MGKILAVVNQKGGVGKTTTTVNLTSALGELGKKCLLVDIDPQGNATSGLGADKRKIAVTAYELFIGTAQPEEAVLPYRLPECGPDSFRHPLGGGGDRDGGAGAARKAAEGGAGLTAGEIRLPAHRLPAVAGPADLKCPVRVGYVSGAHPVRILRAGRGCPS